MLKRIVPLILPLALFLSLAAVLLLYRTARQYYLHLQALRLDPLGLSFYPVEEEQPVQKSEGQKVVVFLGDSRAMQWETPTDPALAERFVFVNRGIHSQTSAQIVGRFDMHVRPLAPDIIVLQMCVNDLTKIPLFPEAGREIVDNCQANIETVITQSRDLGATVILTTVFPLGELPLERRVIWSNDVNQAIEELNDFIHSLAGEGVLILDTAPILTDETGLVQEQYRFDFLHLNEAGYEALNRELVKVLILVD
jgi:lysophospholipase L1-like esterase